ncbi:hypothetical protein VTL71DRAFT_4372 [Oculimacula yallundae]|uniref:Uncharacterized protein n=1 Tax=Oculimacula yallundae TaxID=86028 RepID=A0ABR4C480_9HELO
MQGRGTDLKFAHCMTSTHATGKSSAKSGCHSRVRPRVRSVCIRVVFWSELHGQGCGEQLHEKKIVQGVQRNE